MGEDEPVQIVILEHAPGEGHGVVMAVYENATDPCAVRHALGTLTLGYVRDLILAAAWDARPEECE